jgi:hypothetical protein
MTRPVVYLWNQSKSVSSAEALILAQALEAQVNEDFLPNVPCSGCTVVVANGTPPAGQPTLNLLDTTPPGDEGALGEHHENPDDSTVMNILVGVILSQPGSSVLSGPASVSSVCSHELLEWLGDATANMFAMADDGTSYAWERADAVESNSYQKTVSGQSVTVSDFLLNSFFDPAGKGPYTFVDKTTGSSTVTAPFQTSAGGYQIYEAPEQAQQVTGARPASALSETMGVLYGASYPAWRKEMKAHLGSRLYRRVARARRIDRLRAGKSV